jgi:hypothetical protein
MKVNVLGFTYQVERGYVVGKCEGTTDHIKQTITIDENLDYDNSVETLLHEILHCIEYAMDLDVDEKIITRLSRGLYSVIEDPQNETFWAALAGSDEIMEDEIDVDDVADEVLEGDYWDDPDLEFNDLDWDSEASTRRREGLQYVPSVGEEGMSDGERCPRWTDPEAERSRLSFADAFRCKAEETGRVVVTTTEDYIPGSY